MCKPKRKVAICHTAIFLTPVSPHPNATIKQQNVSGDDFVVGDVLAEVLSSVDTLEKKKKSVAMTVSRKTHMLPSKQRSQFGPQVDSNKRNSYAFGFGTATRFDFNKKEPEPVSYSGGTGARRKKPPQYSVPGPGYYEAGSAIGTQEYSEKRSYPSFGFSKSDRFAQDAREQKQLMGVPAPGTYALPPSTGYQVSSTKETLPVVSFGTAHRDVKVSIGKGYEDDLKGLDTPGWGSLTRTAVRATRPAHRPATKTKATQSLASFNVATEPRVTLLLYVRTCCAARTHESPSIFLSS